MSDLFVKPGNQERGWNDPPQLSYGLQTRAQTGQRKPLLTKRVAAPQLEAPKVCGVAGIPPALTPPGSSIASQIRSSVSLPCKPELSTAAADDCDINVDEVLAPLNKALEACRTLVKKQVCDDIGRRLTILQEMWQNGKLSASVQRRMQKLAREMASCRWDAADDLHRSLMVDHVNEVGQWMVGVKRLIAETKNLPHELTADVAPETETGN